MVDSVVSHLLTARQRPILPALPERSVLEAAVGGELPQAARDPEVVFDQLEKHLSRYSANFLHPGIMGWVAATPVPLAGLLGGWLNALRIFPHSWKLTAGSTHIETTVIRWLGQMIGFSDGAAGYVTTGGSFANMYAVCVARHRALGLDSRRRGLLAAPQLTAYASEHTHMCIRQSLGLLGIGEDHLRQIPVDTACRVRADALEARLQADIASGHKPFCIIGNAGTTNTGAIDDLEALGALGKKYAVWFHVDGSYGAFAAMCPETSGLFKGLSLADSVAIDPHKWLNIPFEAGCILLKSWDDLSEAFSHVPPYLRAGDTPSQHDHWHYGFELSRADRATKVWFELQHYGAKAYQKLIQSHIQLARKLAALIREDAEFELVAQPALSVVCFRYISHVPMDTDLLDRVNAAIEESYLAEGRVLFSGTVIAEKHVLRACIINHRTTWGDVREGLEAARRVGRRLAEGLTQRGLAAGKHNARQYELR
jgi:aromatic-L-amino-acid/L-tryptophan decarboxylase